MKPVSLSLSSAWQYRGIGTLQGMGSKEPPEKPKTRPCTEVLPTIVMAKFWGEWTPDWYILPDSMRPDELRMRGGFLVGSLAYSDWLHPI